MIASLAEAVGHEAIKDSERANSLQFSVEVECKLCPRANEQVSLANIRLSLVTIELFCHCSVDFRDSLICH